MKRKLIKLISFIFIFAVIVTSCNEVSDLNSSNNDLKKLTNSNDTIESHELSDTNDLSSLIEGDWVRVGNSGTGKDIAIKDIPYIIGENNKIYYFKALYNSWELEPGGGEGKMISYQLNESNSASPRLYIRGNNDSIYYKNRGSSSGWTKLSSFSTRSLSTFDSQLSTPIQSLSFVGYSNYDPYYAGNLLTQDYYPNSPGSILQIEEMTGSLINGLYATAWRWENFPCCKDLGDGVYEFSSSNNRWEYIGGEGIDIAMGGPQNDLWMVGNNNRIYKRVNNDWIPTESGTAKRISVSDNGVPYIIGENNKIYKFVQ